MKEVKRFNRIASCGIVSVSLVASLVASLMTGCASTQKANEQNDLATRRATNNFEATANVVPTFSNFTKDKSFWVNPSPLPSYAKSKPILPDFFSQKVSLAFPGKVTLAEVVSEISRSTKISIDVSQDVYEPQGGLGTVVSGSSAGATTQQKDSPAVTIDSFDYRGALSGSLDVLTAKSNLSWKWNGSTVELYRYESRNYHIAALAGSTTQSSTVTSNSAASASGSGGQSGNTTNSGQTTQLKSEVTTWSEVTSYVRSMLSPRGRVSVMESSGMITVRDTPAVLASVDKAVNELNAVLSKQVMINVEVYSVNFSDSDKASVDWDVVWGAATSRVNTAYQSLGNQALAGLNNPLTLGVLKGPFAGTSIVASALSSLGKTSLVTSANLVTLNGQPVPMMVAREIGYLRAISTTVTGSSGTAQTSLDPGSITAGFALNLLPRVQPNGNILMQYSMDLSDLESLTSFTSNGNTIQIPTRSVRNILQRASLRSGETLIMSGFKQVGAKIDKQGVGKAENILFGGTNQAQNSNVQLVVVITPVISINK